MANADERGVRTPPRFCPGCGAELRDTDTTRAVVAVGAPTDGKAVLEPEHPWGWDCYCASCGWSGDVLPDEVFEGPPAKPKRKNKSSTKKATARSAPAKPTDVPEHIWTDADRLTYEEFCAGEPCRNCRRPFFSGSEWVAIMHRTPEQAAAIEAEEADFARLHPDCHAQRWSISGGGITHCARCCAPHPRSPEQYRQVARILLSAQERIVRERAAGT